MFFSLAGWAQDITVSGNVTDESGLPVPGASINVKGGTGSAATDIDGNYAIQVNPDATLVFSFIGYATQEIAVNNKTTINVTLAPAAETLDEVVVVGYGTQKKSVVTGAISSVKAEQIEDLPLTRVEQTLQGRVSGVQIMTNSGQPGSGATIRVRGVTSFDGGSSNPLVIVDGLMVDGSAFGNLNQADIESIEVLKDAASAAIYGTRAASGVIIVTTKKGKAGKLTFNYNGYVGFSETTRKLDLLNAQQYASLRNEQYLNGYTGNNPVLPYPNAATLGRGTDWQDIVFSDNAARTQHDFSVSGGSEKSTFYMSFGTIDQEGIVMPEISRYMRNNIRINSDHKVTSWLKVGEQAYYSHEKNIGIGNTNSEYGGPLASAINLDPTTPAVVSDITTTRNPNLYTATDYAVRDGDGNYYGISDAVQQEMTNPLAYAKIRQNNHSWADNFNASAYAEISPLKGLTFRSQLSGKLAYYGDESFNPISYLSPNSNNSRNSLFRSKNTSLQWNFENFLTYTKLIDNHNFTILLGQGAYQDGGGNGVGVTYYNQPVNNANDASFNWPTVSDDIIGYSFTNTVTTLSSLFARLTYDYKEKYLFTGIIRRDGSSRFGSNNKYGNFPSFSVGWVPTKEDFWQQNDVLNYLKIKYGWGVTGNDRGLGQFAYASLIGGGYNYTVGNNGAVTIGNAPTRPSNPDLKWEETTQSDIGFEATVFKDFSLSVDYYSKKTTGILQTVILPGYVGAANSPFGNVGEMKNTGFDFELGYNKRVGDFDISLNGNLSTLKNEVTSIGQDRDYNSGPSIQSSAYPLTRSEVGQSINSFYGFVTDGIFQNEEEIANAAVPTGVTPVPGDFRFKDLNGDGEITQADRKYIGKPLPDFTYGMTLNLKYKGIDFMVFGQGVSGNQIFQGVRRLDMLYANWQTNALNRWNGEGTSNTYPRLATTDPNGNFSRPSNFYLQDGDYFRIKLMQLGYSLPDSIISKAGLSKFRIYVSGENLVTFTKYTGYDPEIGGDVSGIDRGYYPQARSYMLGCTIQF
ncbi:SusC/RagA family TonB-linked outer membrane protein [Flavobacterium rhizosphaerae]